MLFQLISKGERSDSATFDLGDGDRWLTSRLYIFAVILSELLDCRCMVFLQTQAGVPRRFVGLASCEATRRALASRYEWFEQALRQAQHEPYSFDLSEPQVAENVAKTYLQDELISRVVGKGTDEAPGWVRLGNAPAPGQVREEHAQWIKDGGHLSKILGDTLQFPSLVEGPDTLAKDLERRAVLTDADHFVAVVDDDKRFKRLLDRRAVIERAARQVAEAETAK